MNYYGSTCANCGGWAAAAAVTTAAVTGAAVASANANAANANAPPTLMPMLRPRQPTPTTLDTTPAQPRVTQPRLRLRRRQRHLFHRAVCRSAPGRLHHSHRPRHDLLLVWEYLVQRGLRRKRRLLPRGNCSLREVSPLLLHQFVYARGPRAARLHQHASKTKVGDSLPTGCFDRFVRCAVGGNNNPFTDPRFGSNLTTGLVFGLLAD